MGGSQSSPIPGGGTEGYHVLRVCVSLPLIAVMPYASYGLRPEAGGVTDTVSVTVTDTSGTDTLSLLVC